MMYVHVLRQQPRTARVFLLTVKNIPVQFIYHRKKEGGKTFSVLYVNFPWRQHAALTCRPSQPSAHRSDDYRSLPRAHPPHTPPRSTRSRGGKPGDHIKTRAAPETGHSAQPPSLPFPSLLLASLRSLARAADSILLRRCRGPPRLRNSPEMANARSGVAVNDECMLKFGELQSKRMHRFIIYKLDKNYTEVVVDKVGEREASYEDFTGSLPENDCRYAIYDFDFVTAEDVQKSRIFYILWSPSTAKVRSKMLYASSNQVFKNGLNGIQVELQATDASEISLDEIKDRAK